MILFFIYWMRNEEQTICNLHLCWQFKLCTDTWLCEA